MGSLEQQLLDAGVAEDAVEGVVARAVSWRTTPGGRLLVDRRRRRRVERNMMVVVQHLIEYGVEAGPEGVGAVLTKAPELLLSKPTTNDRWDRRVVELAAFWAQHGHCDVPKVCLWGGGRYGRVGMGGYGVCLWVFVEMSFYFVRCVETQWDVLYMVPHPPMCIPSHIPTTHSHHHPFTPNRHTPTLV